MQKKMTKSRELNQLKLINQKLLVMSKGMRYLISVLQNVEVKIQEPSDAEEGGANELEHPIGRRMMKYTPKYIQ